jgi:hypothetical protein
MPAKQKQINIRDTDIYERAHRLARRLNQPMKEVVRQALKDLDAKAKLPAEKDAETELKLAELRSIQRRIAETAIKRTHEEDDAELYDERGLPR